MALARLSSLVVLAVSLTGCGERAFALLSVNDPSGLALDATGLAVGFSRSALDETQSVDSFPVAVLVTAESEGRREIWLEARRSGAAVAVARIEVDFVGSDAESQGVALESPCTFDDACTETAWTPSLLATGTGSGLLDSDSLNWTTITRTEDGALYAGTDTQLFRIEPTLNARVLVAGNGSSDVSNITTDGAPAFESAVVFTRIRSFGVNSVLITDRPNNRIRTLDFANGQVSELVTSGLSEPRDAIRAPSGAVYIADSRNREVKRLSEPGVDAEVLVGGGESGCIESFVPVAADTAGFERPVSLAVANDSLFIGDDGCRRIYELSLSNETIRVLAGSGSDCSDDGGAETACFRAPTDLTYHDGVLTVVDERSVRAVQIDSGQVTTLAESFSGSVAVHASGLGVEVADREGARLVRLSSDAPVGIAELRRDRERPARLERLSSPLACAVDAQGNVFLSAGRQVFFNDRDRGTLSLYAGVSEGSAPLGDQGPALDAALSAPVGLAVAEDGALWIADRNSHRIRRIDPMTRLIETVVGSSEGRQDGAALTARLSAPEGLAFDGNLGVYIADAGNNQVRYLSFDTGLLTTPVGSGTGGFTDGLGTTAELRNPSALALRADGTLYIFDNGNEAVRVFDPVSGMLSTLAGDGERCRDDVCGDGGPPSAARFSGDARRIALLADGALLIADTENNRVRRILADGSLIESAAGGGTGYSEGAPPGEVLIDRPVGVCASETPDRFFVLTNEDGALREVRPERVETQVGSVASVRDGPLLGADLLEPTGVARLTADTVLVSEGRGRRLRLVRNGTIVTLLGGFQPDRVSPLADDRFTATPGELNGVMVVGDEVIVSDATGGALYRFVENQYTVFAGRPGSNEHLDGALTDARFIQPAGLTADAEGSIFVADEGGHTIRQIDTNGQVTTVVGTANVPGGDFSEMAAQLRQPRAVTAAPSGLVYIADTGNNRVLGYDPTERRLRVVLGTIESPASMVVDSNGQLFVAARREVIAINGGSSRVVFSLASAVFPRLLLGRIGALALLDEQNGSATRLMVADPERHRLIELVAE
ncbi:MAG: hypothetical protein AAF654_07465 [Myxococcota bacterium]